MGNPRQGITSRLHTVHIHWLEPEVHIREPTEKYMPQATATAGPLTIAVRFHRLLRIRCPSLFSMTTGGSGHFVVHAATLNLRGTHLPRTTGSLDWETDLNRNQKDEQPAEHAFIVR